MRIVLAVSAVTLMAACASTTTETAPVVADLPPQAETTTPSQYQLAMGTVEDLLEAGNEQAAILRLEQLVGMQAASEAEKASALYRMAELKMGEGNQIWGAIENLDEFIETYPDHEMISAAIELRDYARGEATSLNFQVEQGGLSPMEEFKARFRLGEHQDAADIMLTNALTPANEYLLDMYQIGYLCDDVELTGPQYKVTEPDGTDRTVRFCDFGK
ncbi:MAG: hypothetical protein NXH72_14810 [Hyphomonadaceae bacterium]|nr:hypothetical protein [Hyphomonadaceae bacterium]